MSTAVEYSRDSHTQHLCAVLLSLHFSPTDFGEQKADVTREWHKTARVAFNAGAWNAIYECKKCAASLRKLHPTRALQKAVHRRALIELGFWNICRALWCRVRSLLPFRVTSHVRNRRRHTQLTPTGLVPSAAPGCYAAQHGKHFTYKWKKPFVLLCGRKCAAALAERRDNNLWSVRAAFQG